jgi:hypothetical protein
MQDELPEEWELENLLVDWIRKHGAEASEKKARDFLLKQMPWDDVDQLLITVSDSDEPNRFEVKIEGPAGAVRKAKAVLYKTYGSR